MHLPWQRICRVGVLLALLATGVRADQPALGAPAPRGRYPRAFLRRRPGDLQPRSRGAGWRPVGAPDLSLVAHPEERPERLDRRLLHRSTGRPGSRRAASRWSGWRPTRRNGPPARRNTPRPTNVPANLYLPFDDPENYWGQFMFKLAQRYAGPDQHLDRLERAGPVLRHRSPTPGTARISDMYQLVKVAYQAVKKANPDAKIALRA